jgi:hypothetical protein
LLQAASHGHDCPVLLFDLSTAFDTIDHGILGIRGKTLARIASYLTNRTQSVVIDSVASEPVKVK